MDKTLLVVRVDASLIKSIQARAKQNERNVSQEVRLVLKKEFEPSPDPAPGPPGG